MQPTFACEPILPLVKLLGGPNWFAMSLYWLLGAIFIKSLAFAFFQKDLSRSKAVVAMVFGNIISTIPSVIVAATSGSGTIFLSVPALYVLLILPAKRLSKTAEWRPLREASAGTITAVCTGGILISIVLFYFAQSVIDSRPLGTYWLFKFCFVTVSLLIGMFLTSLWEEWGIALCCKQQSQTKSYLTPVFRANALTFAVILFVAAVQILPSRYKSPNFLVWWHGVEDWIRTASS